MSTSEQNTETEISALKIELEKTKNELAAAVSELNILRDKLALARKKLAIHLEATSIANKRLKTEQELIRTVSVIKIGEKIDPKVFREIQAGKFKWGPLLEALHECVFTFSTENITIDEKKLWKTVKSGDLFVEIHNPSIQTLSFFVSDTQSEDQQSTKDAVTIHPHGTAKIKLGRYKVGSEKTKMTLILLNGDKSYVFSLRPQSPIKV